MNGRFWFWLFVILLIFAPAVIIAVANVIGPLLTTLAHNAQQVANSVNH